MIKILKLFKIIILLNIFYFSFLSISYPCSFNCPKSELFTDDEGHLGLKTSKHSGYDKHVNYMGQHDYNYSYIYKNSLELGTMQLEVLGVLTVMVTIITGQSMHDNAIKPELKQTN